MANQKYDWDKLRILMDEVLAEEPINNEHRFLLFSYKCTTHGIIIPENESFLYRADRKIEELRQRDGQSTVPYGIPGRGENPQFSFLPQLITAHGLTPQYEARLKRSLLSGWRRSNTSETRQLAVLRTYRRLPMSRVMARNVDRQINHLQAAIHERTAVIEDIQEELENPVVIPLRRR